MSMTESESIHATFEDAIYCAKSWCGEVACEECRLYLLGDIFCQDTSRIMAQAMEELVKYRAIGTVSEFRELKEKAIKKVEKCKDKYYCECGCPVEIMLDGITLKPIGGQVYCDQCGAKLDWSEFVEAAETEKGE